MDARHLISQPEHKTLPKFNAVQTYIQFAGKIMHDHTHQSPFWQYELPNQNISRLIVNDYYISTKFLIHFCAQITKHHTEVKQWYSLF